MAMYSRLPPSPSRKEPPVEVFPDTKETDTKPGLSNYLDEFLSAIKVFGYLERPVFHELTRTIQTKKMIAGETLLLEEEKGFCLVVDGLVQIFVKSNLPDAPKSRSGSLADNESDDQFEEEGHGYQLLTEVRNGAPMSSLFSVLSLFTDDVHLRHDETSNPLEVRPASSASRPDIAARHSDRARSSTPSPAAPMYQLAGHHPRQVSQASQTSALDMGVPPMSLETGDGLYGSDSPVRKQVEALPASSPHSAHPNIVARASVDTTIAIIPATAFHRLTRIYPKATAQIVQVILTRLHRVTLATANSYLGLSNEVLRTERLMDKFTAYDLPDYLKGDALERLKFKFQQERERSSHHESANGIALHNPRATQPKRTTDPLHTRLGQVFADATTKTTPIRPASARPPAYSRQPTFRDSGFHTIESRSGVSAGDLLTTDYSPVNQMRQRGPSFPQSLGSPGLASPMQQRVFNPLASPSRVPPAPLQRKDSVDEDHMFRESILECMLKATGLHNYREAQRPAASTPLSPRLLSYDAKRQKASFSSAFGFLDPFDVGGDGDSETGTSVSGVSTQSPINVVAAYASDIEIVFFPKDAVLVEQGEKNPGLYYVIDGFLDASVANEDNKNILGNSTQAFPQKLPSDLGSPSKGETSPPARAKTIKDTRNNKSLYLIKPGGLAGYIGTVGSHRSFIDVTAKTDVYVGFLSKAVVEKIVERFPNILLTMAKRLTSLLPRLLLHIDFALEWVQVNAGQVIFNQRDESDAIYIVLNGRLRALQDLEDNTVKVIGEYGQGDSVGELEVMAETCRPGTLHAIRDTELAKFPKSLFNSLALEHPGITIKVSKIIASRMRTLLEGSLSGPAATNIASDKTTSTSNLRTVTILPVTAGVPVVEFGQRLLAALNQIGIPNGVVTLCQTTILNHLGRHAFSRMGKLKLSQYLADLEEKYGLLLYIADTNVKSPWTQTCINQADCILLVGLAESSSSIGEYERLLLTTKTTARKELVLLHSERYCPPGLTRKWLRNRSWINGSHHHIHMSFTVTSEPVQPQLRRLGTALKHRVQVLQAEIQKYTSRKVRQTPLYSAETPFKGDFHRLARRLCGKSVGLVLGGGGARGFAHVGIIRAMEEAGIPIDIVGGTSIGSFIGALYAWDADVVPMYGRAKKFAGRWGSLWRFALDLTYPS